MVAPGGSVVTFSIVELEYMGSNLHLVSIIALFFLGFFYRKFSKFFCQTARLRLAAGTLVTAFHIWYSKGLGTTLLP